MIDRWRPLATAITVLVVACLFVAPIAPGVAVGGAAGDIGVGSVGVDTLGSDIGANGAAGETEGGSHAAEGVGPGLESVNGSVQLVVRFEADTEVSTDGAGTGDPAANGSGASRAVSTDGLRSHAADAQADFEAFAGADPAVTVDRSFWLANAMLVTVDTERVPVDRLLDVPGVERVHGNFAVELDSAAAAGSDADPTGSVGGTLTQRAGPTATQTSISTASTDATYGVGMVRAPEVWETFDTRGEGATVAVIDTGIDPDHPDLTVSGWAEIDESGGVIQDDGPHDLNGHGTHVAGTVGGGNASGTAIGVAPEATVHGIKVFPGDERETTFTRVVGGMEAALNDSVGGGRADVLQMSLGADDEYVAGFIEPVRNARSTGAVVVASSGNSGHGTSSSPANVYDSLAVGAVDENRDVDSISSGETITTEDAWGEDVPDHWPAEYVVPDVSAPGVDVLSAEPGGTYGERTGTSMAAPHASGVVALMLSASTRDVSGEDLYDILRDTLRDTADHPDDTDPSHSDDRYGTGIVDAFAAVSSVTENRSNLTVTDFEAPNETVPGATLETTATINNTGEDPGVGTVEYRFNDTVGDEANVSLQPGEETTVGFSYVVSPDTETNRSYVHGVYTDDSNLTAGIDVLDTPFYEVTNLSAPDIVERGGSLNATANVTNRGVADGEKRTVELRLTDPGNESDVSVLAGTNLTLGAGNGTTVPLNGTVPGEFETGETTVAIASPEDGDAAPIRIADAVGTIDGTVTDAETNATLPGIDVTVENGTEVVGGTTTGDDGTYALDVPATNLTVTASNATYAPANTTVTLNESGDTATANFSLTQRDGTLSGVVGATDGLDRPTNATITVTNGTGDAVATVDVAETGTYTTDLRPGTYNVTADAPDFNSETLTGVDVAPNATTDRSFGLAPLSATLFGTVTDGTDDTPIEGATVTIGSGTVTTDPDGNYQTIEIPRGEYGVIAAADGYTDSSLTVELAANETRELDLSLDPRPIFTVPSLSGPNEIERGESGSFTVDVRNDGQAAGDASLTVDVSPSGTADPNPVSITDVAVDDRRSGSFSVAIDEGASTGPYSVTVTTDDDSRTASFEVVSGEDDDDGSSSGGGSSGGGGGGGGSGGGGGAPPGEDTEDADEEETEEDADEEPEDDGGDEETEEDADEETEDGGEGGEPEDDAEGGSEDDTGDGEPEDADEPTDDAIDEEAETDDDATGFGVLAAVVSLAAAMLAVRNVRRENEQ